MGTRFVFPPALRACQDHPHAYGDKSAVLSVDEHTVGSSPRVWGQVYQKYDGNQPVRIIPTRMGTSKIVIEEKHAEEDHPHAYGDKIACICG